MARRRGDLVGIVREIVDDRNAVRMADRLETSPQSLEAAERAGGVWNGNPERPHRGDRGERVRRIMMAGDLQVNLMPLVIRLEAEAGSAGLERELRTAKIGVRAFETVADELFLRQCRCE